MWHPGGFYLARGESLVCTLCPRACVLAEDALGFCQVRRRRGERMETATFAASLMHWDPVERKPLYHYRPGSEVLTLAAPGCNLRCLYCQNHRLSQYGRELGSRYGRSPGVVWDAEAMDPAALVASAAGRRAALGLSYSEPGLAAELTMALAELGAPAGVDVLWKSNGFLTPESALAVAGCLAAANLDLKTLDRRRHRALTGVDPAPVLETLAILLGAGVWVEVSTPLIPGVNTDPRSLRALARTIAGLGRWIPWHLVRFVPEYRLARLPPTPTETIARALAIGREAGLDYVYTARALGDAGRATRCPGCGHGLIGRGHLGLAVDRLEDGRCPDCRMAIPGRWSGGVGLRNSGHCSRQAR
jgi:pyruvate formate lyase activating enzyme